MNGGLTVHEQSTFDRELSATRYAQQQAPEAVTRVAALVGQNARVLEIGPATGMLTRIIATEQNCEVTAIEIDATAAERARPLCKALHVADLESVDLDPLLRNQTFDVVTFGDVLEHLRSPVSALRKIKPYIADGGSVVLSVPNIAHASVAFELANGRFDYRPTGLLDFTHIRFFTRKSLLQTVDDAGFVVTAFERVIVSPEQTEFGTKAYSEGQQQLLEYLQTASPESLTYQFIARIVPRKADVPYVSEAVIEDMARAMEKLQGQIDAERARANRFESQLNWIEDRWHLRWARRLKAMVTSEQPDR